MEGEQGGSATEYAPESNHPDTTRARGDRRGERLDPDADRRLPGGRLHAHDQRLPRLCLCRRLCGLYCYAQHNRWITKGRPWGLYGAKGRVVEAYRRGHDRIRRPRRGEPGPLRIYMSSSTDPYIPQEKSLRLTRVDPGGDDRAPRTCS